MLFILTFDTLAGVTNIKSELESSVIQMLSEYDHGNLTVIGVFDRIINKIHKDLSYPELITDLSVGNFI